MVSESLFVVSARFEGHAWMSITKNHDSIVARRFQYRGDVQYDGESIVPAENAIQKPAKTITRQNWAHFLILILRTAAPSQFPFQEQTQ
jgi:hypothetical protein